MGIFSVLACTIPRKWYQTWKVGACGPIVTIHNGFISLYFFTGMCAVPNISHGTATPHPSGDTINHGDGTVTFQCDEGYDLHYGDTATCDNGTLSNIAQCVEGMKYCQYPTIQRNLAIRPASEIRPLKSVQNVSPEFQDRFISEIISQTCSTVCVCTWTLTVKTSLQRLQYLNIFSTCDWFVSDDCLVCKAHSNRTWSYIWRWL